MKGIWQKILETAIHAPSPHNVQPWRVKILSETEAGLYIDSTRTLPKEDVTGSFIILTMGLFIEALTILAAREDFKLTYELFREPDWYAPAILEDKGAWLIPFARLKLAAGAESIETYDEELFYKRRTSRLHLRDEKISAGAINSLSEIAASWDQIFFLLNDKRAVEEIMRHNTEALFEDLNSKDYHDEIVEWFRFSDRESAKHLDGLDFRCMNTPRATFWLSARMPWLMKTPVVSSVLAKVYRAQLGAIPTLGFIAGGFWRPADAVNAGRFLMRFWLETAARDLYIHPFGNLVTNRRAAAFVERETQVSDIWLVFKIGRSAAPPKSRRLPVERILIS